MSKTTAALAAVSPSTACRCVGTKPRAAAPASPDCRDTIVALHCSGGSPAHWRTLAACLGEGYRLHALPHSVAADLRLGPADGPFTLAAEAEPSLRLIDGTDAPVHLVGHSYGGALALHIALRRAERVASVTLFEPCAFHLLPQLGAGGREASVETCRLAASIEKWIGAGEPDRAMAGFVDYWNGTGAWEALTPEQRRALTGWAPKAVHDFDALLGEPTPLGAYERLQVPVRLLQGARSPSPTQLVSAALAERLPSSDRVVLPGVGHMGPLTHADAIAALVVEQIERHAVGASRRRPGRPGSPRLPDAA